MSSTTSMTLESPTGRLIYGTSADDSPSARSRRGTVCPACTRQKPMGEPLCEDCGSPEALSGWVNGGGR